MQISNIENYEDLTINDQMEVNDAYSFVVSFLEDRIKYYKTLYLRHWERNHDIKSDYYNQKVQALIEEKEKFKSFSQKANLENKTISLNCNLRFQAI